MFIFGRTLAFSLILGTACLNLSAEENLADSSESASEQPLKDIRFVSEVIAPYYWYTDEGTAQGFNVDIANALGKELNIASPIEELPWARAFQETLLKPNNVLLSLLRISKREKQFQWLGVVHHIKASLVGLNNGIDIELASLEDAKQLRIGTIRGYGSADYLLNQGFIEATNLVLVSDTSRVWQLLYEGRIDLVVGDIAADRHEVASIGLDPDLIEEKLLLPALSVELQIATGNHTPVTTVKSLQDAMTTIRERGELQELLSKWGL